MSVSVRWSDFSMEAWARLLKGMQEKDRYLYQTCKYESGSLILSYEVMSCTQYENAYKEMRGQIECVAETALSVLQACRRETRKLSLYEIFWITERRLNQDLNLESITLPPGQKDWGLELHKKVVLEQKEVGTALGEMVGSVEELSESLTQFYNRRVAPHRQGFCGWVRETISRIQDIFNKYRNESFAKIFEAKGHEARCKDMAQCIEDFKRRLARDCLEGVGQNIIDQAPTLMPNATPPPKNRKEPVTPLLERIERIPATEKVARSAQEFRDKLKVYLGLLPKAPELGAPPPYDLGETSEEDSAEPLNKTY